MCRAAGIRVVMATGDYERATTLMVIGIVAFRIGNVFACRTGRESVFRVSLLGTAWCSSALPLKSRCSWLSSWCHRCGHLRTGAARADRMGAGAGCPAVMLVLDEGRTFPQRAVARRRGP
jgi:hypothetical protein